MTEQEEQQPGQQDLGTHQQRQPRHERQSTRWASKDAWQVHRQIISHMYSEYHMTLKEVKEAMERQYGFISTERAYKYRFKQWGLGKYRKHPKMDDNAKRQEAAKPSHPPPHRSAASSPSPNSCTTISRPSQSPAELRILDKCLGHLHSFIRASYEDQRRPESIDPSYDMYMDRATWTYSIHCAITEIHRGRFSKGFSGLDTCFAQFRHSLAAHDTAYPLRLISTLALFTDSGLPGLDTIFLQYIYHGLCTALSPGHPFSTITRYLLVMSKKRLEFAWFMLAKYSDMLWKFSAPAPSLVSAPEPVFTFEPASVLAEMSWDVARSIDRDLLLPPSCQATNGDFLPDHFSFSLSIAHINLTQRLYSAARRKVDNLLAHCSPVRDPLDVALVYRKRWQINRAEGRDDSAICKDGHTFVGYCRTALGSNHYMTTRAVEEHQEYLRERRAAGTVGRRSEDTPTTDDGTRTPLEWDLVLERGLELQGNSSSDILSP